MILETDEEFDLADKLWAIAQSHRPDQYDPAGMSGEPPVDIAIAISGVQMGWFTVPRELVEQAATIYATRDDYSARAVMRDIKSVLEILSR
ncbi:hypothetical protein [Actinomyces faecalis]|uniref:hypothetical protein n=1 Tax=Actinomyces faecalis TaxID=2722820 RepID=UPI0015534CFC|nr:hypothetical protein [Actinomyces faecalis]